MTAPRVEPGSLTPTQREVLVLAANGLTSKQIAAAIGRSTVAVHLRVRYACDSLGASSRTHAVAIALVRGLIRPDEVAAAGSDPLCARLRLVPPTEAPEPRPTAHGPSAPRPGPGMASP